MVRAVRESRATTWGLVAAGLAIGLSPYTYLVLADGPASWGPVESVSDLLGFVLRREYGTGSLSGAGADVPWSTSLAAWAVTVSFPAYPLGVLRRVLPRTATPPAPGEVMALNRQLYRAFDLDDPRPDRSDEYASLAHVRYAATWAAIAKALDKRGDRDGAQDAWDLAYQLLPTGEPEVGATPAGLPVDLAPLRRRDRGP